LGPGCQVAGYLNLAGLYSLSEPATWQPPVTNFKIPVTFSGVLSSHHKTGYMQKNTYLGIGLIGFLLVASFIILLTSHRPKERSVCKESIDKESIKCPSKNSSLPGGMVWENLSRQFISIKSAY
jgi:hypothetical protein